MSEYQYYDFRSIDKPFTAEQRKKLSAISSHADITSNSVSIEYNWGNFKGDVNKLMREYFDMMLYVASYGIRQLMFRIPLSLVKRNVIDQYCTDEEIFMETYKDQLIIDLFFGEDDISYWIEGERLLDDMLDLRAELLIGDYRCLYLAWLKTKEWLLMEDSGNFATEKDLYDKFDEELLESLEPPVPPGLGSLSEAQRAFADFLDIDEALIEAAAKNSSPMVENPKTDLGELVMLLTPDEQLGFLRRLSLGEPNLTAFLNERLRELARAGQPEEAEIPEGTRSVKELILSTFKRKEEIIIENQKKAERARRKRLEETERNEKIYWDEIIMRIEEKPHSYDDVVRKLKDLKELTDEKKQSDRFRGRIKELINKYPNRSGLIRHLKALID